MECTGNVSETKTAEVTGQPEVDPDPVLLQSDTMERLFTDRNDEGSIKNQPPDLNNVEFSCSANTTRDEPMCDIDQVYSCRFEVARNVSGKSRANLDMGMCRTDLSLADILEAEPVKPVMEPRSEVKDDQELDDVL
ncbi:hypothetical protein DPMN_072726 [Dreissena polymorpha]|uniref:Uncharacterized protein n=1 Tax=Dreissena polymorpha TaxID=45954 RepID=A0A9D4H9V1_DREPO|nr:hypothetical protein DPMN_072726 [Dreissena polymorpha]